MYHLWTFHQPYRCTEASPKAGLPSQKSSALTVLLNAASAVGVARSSSITIDHHLLPPFNHRCSGSCFSSWQTKSSSRNSPRASLLSQRSDRPCHCPNTTTPPRPSITIKSTVVVKEQPNPRTQTRKERTPTLLFMTRP